MYNVNSKDINNRYSWIVLTQHIVADTPRGLRPDTQQARYAGVKLSKTKSHIQVDNN